MLKQLFNNKKIVDMSFLLACLGIASYFIFHHITARSFWLDEAWIANLMHHPQSLLPTTCINETNLLFYHYLTKIWTVLFGVSELSLRGFSALFGLALVYTIYKTAGYIFNNRRAGQIALFIASTNYFLIWYSIQARGYTLAATLGLLSHYFYIKATKEPSKRNYITYAITSALGAYTHPWLMILPIAHLLSSLLFRKQIRNWTSLVKTQLISLLLATPGAIIILSYQNTTAYLTNLGLIAIQSSFIYFTYKSTPIYLYVSIISTVIIIYRVIKSQKSYLKFLWKQPDFFPLASTFIYLFLPLFFFVAISYWKPAFEVGRHEMTVLPAFILLVAYLWSQLKNKYAYLIIFILLISAANKSVSDDYLMVKSFKADDKTISQGLLATINQRDIFISTGLSRATYYYYLSSLNKAQHKTYDFISFPMEMIMHPAYQDLPKMISQQKTYEIEAKQLVDTLKKRSNPNSKIWLLYDHNPISYLLLQELQKNMKQLSFTSIPEPHQPMWLSAVFVFSLDSHLTANSPSTDRSSSSAGQ